MSGRVLVTPRSLSRDPEAEVFEPLRRRGFELVCPTPGERPNEATLREAIGEVVGYIAGVEPISRAVLEQGTQLRAISRNGTGVDNIDLEAAEELGITVRRAAGANARGVAELTLGLMLDLARGISSGDAEVKRGNWTRRKGIELPGRTLGLVGCGQVGQDVARLALAFGMSVLAYDHYPDPHFAPGGSFRYAGLDELLAESDIVSLHCPPPPDGSAVIDRRAVSLMPRGAYLINTARAGLVDWAAVEEAVDTGGLGGFAVDSYADEPPEPDSLIRNPATVATPHIGGYTEESVERASRIAVENLIEELER